MKGGGGRRKAGKELDESRYRKAVRDMKNGVLRARTKVAFYKLTGRGGADVDAVGAVALLEESAKKGDNEAEWMLGLCCEYGIGIQQDVERAELLFKQSCEAKNGVGQFLLENNLGERGSGVMKVHKSL